MNRNDQFTADLKKLSNLEREIFDLHKRQKSLHLAHKSRHMTRQIDVNYDMMDENLKRANKRLKI